MGGTASSNTAEIYMQVHESTAISTAIHPPKVWEQLAMEEESNGELAFLDSLLKWSNGEISVLVYRKSTY